MGGLLLQTISVTPEMLAKDKVALTAPGAASTSTEMQLQYYICTDTHRVSCALSHTERMLLTVLKHENSNLSACHVACKQTSSCKTEP